MPRAGLEPATSRSSVSHSPKLSYRGAGGANGGREKRVCVNARVRTAIAGPPGAAVVINEY